MKGWPGEPEMELDVLKAEGEAAPNAGKPITDVIFDFGNVLIYWDPAAAFVSRYSQETIDRVLDNDISGFYDASNMMDEGGSGADAVQWVRETHGEQWAEMCQWYLDNFEDSLVGIVPGMRMLLKDLKNAGIGVWGLSNWSAELFPYAERTFPILKLLDDKVVSGYVKLRKPHRDIYECALTQFGIDAQGALFVDDKASNIVGANEAAIRGVRFSDPLKLRELLIVNGVNIPAVR